MSTPAVLSSENEKLKQNTLQPWFVCISAALFFFYEFIQMGMFNSISTALMHDFNINAVQLGNLSATYFYADVAFLFLAGMLLDRFSVRKIILSAMILCVASTVMFALSPNAVIAGIGHFIAGIGNAFCFLSCIKLASRWFPSDRMALVVGITVTIAMAGGVVAQTPLILLVQTLGWREAVMVDALLGAFITAIVWYYVYDKEPTEEELKIAASAPNITVKESIWFAISNKQNWLGGIYTCFLNLPIFLLGELWGVMYLNQVHNISTTHASVITSMVFIGTIIGSPSVGWVSDSMGKRRLPMIIGAICSLVTILLIMFVPTLNFTSLLILFLALGFFTSTQIISYPAITESNPNTFTGISVGLASVLIMGGGAVFQPLFGWLMDLHWDGKMVDGHAFYSPDAFLFGMAIMPIAFIIGLAAAITLRETNCQPYEHK